MKVLILTKYGAEGASSRYRFYNYVPYFVHNNIDFEILPLLSNKYVKNLYSNKKLSVLLEQIRAIFKRIFFLIFNKKKYDLLIIEKELLPHIPYFVEQILLRNQKYMLDYDDYVGASYKTGVIKNMLLGNKIQRLVQNANLVTVGNRWYFKEFKSNNLHYLPTVIDVEKYPKQQTQKHINTIAWIGSPSTTKYLKSIEYILIDLSEKYDFELKIIGGKIELDKRIKTVYKKWSADSENEELANSTIGIMPLEKTLWEYGKCGFKLIQYMASGLPVIGTDLPANEEIIIHGKNGYVAKNNKDWYAYLSELLQNRSKSIEMGKAGRKRVEEYYSYQVWGDKYSRLINEMAKK